MTEEKKDTQYIPPTKEELLLQDFLEWCGKEHGAVLVDITPNVARMASFTFVSHPKMIKEYLEARK